MGLFDGVRAAFGGGPRYTPAVSRYAPTREQDKNAKVRAKEAEQAAGRRRRHRAAVAKKGDAAGVRFGFDDGRGHRRT
ncbi:hypothetical protein QFZ66_005851 [Streptomyces sp. B4I13]|uniref:hypothetical protein n=1 Tax=unclassified Streptomyces TaxID=2593676 RepID=UPI00277FC0D9|nr:hypothetical protein [Streptomyces sp. B4I13]MDQ0961973.1 hypothetical protein [Streptomyces sp. B4I13]